MLHMNYALKYNVNNQQIHLTGEVNLLKIYEYFVNFVKIKLQCN